MPTCYDAVAYLLLPIDDRQRISTRDRGREHVFAETAEAAALKFYWTLGSLERAQVHRLILWPPKPNSFLDTYDGPALVYERKDGRLHLVEVRNGAAETPT